MGAQAKIRNTCIVLLFCMIAMAYIALNNKLDSVFQNFKSSLLFSEDPQALQGVQKSITKENIFYSPHEFFDEWVEQNADETAWQKDLPECPERIEIKYTPENIPLVIHPDPEKWSPVSPAGSLHGKAVYEIRSLPVGHASAQCTYGIGGQLFRSEIPEAGSADYFSPALNKYLHYVYDVEPYILARALGREEDYYKARPPR